MEFWLAYIDILDIENFTKRELLFVDEIFNRYSTLKYSATIKNLFVLTKIIIRELETAEVVFSNKIIRELETAENVIYSERIKMMNGFLNYLELMIP